MSTYYCAIDVDSNDSSPKMSIQAGQQTLDLSFQWAVASTEQYALVEKYITQKSFTDPILRTTGEYDREYNWYEYYAALVNTDLEEWLSETTELPQSLRNKDKDTQLRLLNTYVQEARDLTPIVTLYSECICWQFSISSTNDTMPVTGFVRPGGWYRGDDTYSIKFVTLLDKVGRYDLNKCILVIEVADE